MRIICILIIYLTHLLACTRSTSHHHEVSVSYDQSSPSPDSQELFIEDQGHQTTQSDGECKNGGGSQRQGNGKTHLPQMSPESQQAVDDLSDLWEMIMSRMSSRLDRILPMLKQMVDDQLISDREQEHEPQVFQYQDNGHQQELTNYELIEKKQVDVSSNKNPHVANKETRHESWEGNKVMVKQYQDHGSELRSLQINKEQHVDKTTTLDETKSLVKSTQAEVTDPSGGQVVTPQLFREQKGDNEMNYQESLEYKLPVTSYFDDQEDPIIRLEEVQHQDQKSKLEHEQQSAYPATTSPASRVRESLRQAADAARDSSARSRDKQQKQLSGLNSRLFEPQEMRSVFGFGLDPRTWRTGFSLLSATSAPTSVPTSIKDKAPLNLDPTFGEASNRHGWSVEEPIRGPTESASIVAAMASTNNSTTGSTTTNSMMQPKFLGYGQLRRIETNGQDGRTQARLSCQFADSDASAPMKQMTIRNVEWTKFSGPFNTKQLEPPPFDCEPDSGCLSRPIKTDLTTTIHPRPAIQTYTNILAPSYQLTLHDVQPKNLGVYRCSAMREVGNGNLEQVFRLIALE